MPQNETRATFAPKLTRELARIDWTKDGVTIARLVRALDPRPGAWAALDGVEVKLFSPKVMAPPFPGTGAPGELLSADGSLVIATGPFKEGEAARSKSSRSSRPASNGCPPRLAARRAPRRRKAVHLKRPLPVLHAITDEQIARRPDLDDVARELSIGGHPHIGFHARGRGLTGLEHYELAARLSKCAFDSLFVNDRLDVALTLRAAGVQLGRGSLPVNATRALEHRWWIGRSVHGLAEALTAKAEGADYLW